MADGMLYISLLVTKSLYIVVVVGAVEKGTKGPPSLSLGGSQPRVPRACGQISKGRPYKFVDNVDRSAPAKSRTQETGPALGTDACLLWIRGCSVVDILGVVHRLLMVVRPRWLMAAGQSAA